MIESVIETPVPAKKKKKKKRKKPILDLSALSSSTPKNEVIDLTDEKTERRSLDFIPLVASTPFAKNKPSNPLSLKKKPKNVLVNKRNSLKKLLEEECSNSQRSVKSLKDFLSRVNP